MTKLPPLSEQASLECRREIVAACRLKIEASALDKFMESFTGNFRRLCDGDNGPAYWARLGGNMRANGRFIGSFAEYFAKNKPNQTVELYELTLALEIVRATCDDQVHMPTPEGHTLSPRFELCAGLQPDPAVKSAVDTFISAVVRPTAHTYRIATSKGAA